MRTAALVAMLLMVAPALRAAAPVEPERRSAVVRAVEKAGPAVVNISTERLMKRAVDPFFDFRDKFFENAFGDFHRRHSRTNVQNSLGSGVVISADGYILTNAHVVTRSRKITVTFPDKTQYAAKLINVDPDHDIALLRVTPKKPLTAVVVGTSADLMIGETVIAIGNPFGLQNSVTTGVVSATGRSIKSNGREVFKGLLQTDAAINPGNSGGALLNIKGELIAINTAVQAGAEGIGFAIPVDAAMASACDLLDLARLKRIALGVGIRRVRGKGLFIFLVAPKGPIAAAGLKPGDKIVQIDGQDVRSAFCYRRILFEHKPGDTVVFKVERGGKAVEAKVKLGLVPEPSPRGLARKKLGIDVQPMAKDIAEMMGVPEQSGVLISRVEKGGPAARGGLKASDIIVYVGRHRVKKVRELGMLLRDLKAGVRLPILLVRSRRLFRAAVTSR
jgi:S1-C subfamily serine protease